MKTLLAAALILTTTAAMADWENVFMNPDLAVNHEGHTTESTVIYDPIATTYSGNSDLFAGAEAGDVIDSDPTPSSLDRIGRGNPDLDCGCI